MVEFRSAHAEGRDWNVACQTAVAKLGGLESRFTLGFVYVNDPIGGDLDRIHHALRRTTGIDDWVGAVGYGVCGVVSGGAAEQAPVEGREYFDHPAMALLVSDLPREDYRIFTTGAGDLGDFHRTHRDWLAAAQPRLAVVHGDSHNPRTPELIARLAEETGAFLVGGMASFTSLRSQIAGGTTGGGLSGVMFSSRVAAVSGLSQGSLPLGPIHRITNARDSVLAELDGQPALDVLKADLGVDNDRDLRRMAAQINVALLVPGSDIGDYMVRNLIGIDPLHGLVAIGDTVEPGGRLMFCARDRDSALTDLRRMVGDVALRAELKAKGGLYFSCVARGPNLFGPNAEEVRLLRDGLGAIPLAGFYANGEINHNRLYGYTGVLAVFL